jgi:hypothetical protein
MSLRTFLSSVLKTDTALAQVFNARVYADQSVMTAQTVKPYIIFKLMNDLDEGFDDPDVQARPHRQFVMVYVHGERPSYTDLDDYCALVKDAFRLRPSSSEDRITWMTFIEQSADFDDVSLDTVFRYLRFQAVMT